MEVVEQGGFSAAAKKMEIPRSRISRRIDILEKNLGIRLIHRSTRQFLVSEVGHEYYQHCRAMVIEALAAQEVVDRIQAVPQGTIRISCPSAITYSKVGKIISDFLIAYPKVCIILESTNRQVDIIKEGFDIAIRVVFDPLENSGLTIKKLAERPQKLVASPTFMSAIKHDVTIHNVASLPSLAWGSPEAHKEWTLDHKDKKNEVIRHNPRYISEDLMALRMAALAGAGICQLPEYIIRDDLKARTLVPVLPEWTSRTSVIYIAFPSRRGLLPSVRKFIDSVSANF